MSFNTIIDPVNGSEYSILSPEGQKLLKIYVKSIMSGGTKRKGTSKNPGGNPLGRQGKGKTNTHIPRISQKNKQGLKTERTINKQAKYMHKQKQIYMRRKLKYELLQRKVANVMEKVPKFDYLNDTIIDYIDYLASEPDILKELIYGRPDKTGDASTEAPENSRESEDDINNKIDEIYNNIKMANLETYATPTKILSSLSAFIFDDSLSLTDRLGMMLMMLRLLQYVWTMLGVSVDPPQHVGIMFDSYTDYMNDYIKIVEEEVNENLVAGGISRRDVFTTREGIKYTSDSYGSLVPKSIIANIQDFIETRKNANKLKVAIFIVSGLLMGFLHAGYYLI